MTFVDRERELAVLEQFWRSERAECIPVTGRRRVGKTFLLEHFAQGKRAVYYRCLLTGTPEQLPALGQALADLAGDPVLAAQPPTSWAAVFALIEQLAQRERLLLVLDEIPYWAARDASLPSALLFARASFADDVRRWADGNNAQLLMPENMLASFKP
jgi:uncharacterized protein